MNRLRGTASRLARWSIAAFLVVLAAGAARAHEGAPTSFASLTVDHARLQYSLTTASQPPAGGNAWDGLPAEPAGGAAGGAAGGSSGASANTAAGDPARMASLLVRHLRIEADGHRCQPGAADFVPPAPPRLSTTYNIEFRCPAPIRTLSVTDDSFDFVGRGSHILVQVQVAGQERPPAPPVLLADERRSASFDLQATALETQTLSPATTGAAGFLPLGVQHILEGWDHLLFLLALVLPGGSFGNLVRIVTAFTVAHSITLGAAALELVSVPAAPVEALIALSIGWVAAENLARVKPMSRRWAVAFAFGLVHGFGFANVLREIGLPRDALLSSLLWFNVGIEIGQLLVVLLLVPALAWLRGLRRGDSLPQAVSALILATSVVLVVQRL